MINRHIRDHTQRKLRLKTAAYYAKVAEVQKRYGTIARDEAAYVLAAENGIDLTKRLDAATCDRIRDIRSKEPVGSRAPSSQPVAPVGAARSRGKRAAEPPADRKRSVATQCLRRPRDVLECVGLHPRVIDVSRKLFLDRHYPEAVEAALKLFDNSVKDKARRPTDKNGRELTGASLMNAVFSPHNPVLKLNALRTDSQKSEQTGYMNMAAGAMTGLRNPRAHESTWSDEPQGSLELLAFVSHLMRKLDGAKRSRSRRVTPKQP